MSHSPSATNPAIYKPMVARDPHAAHRSATTLELLNDLVFVAAIAMAADELHLVRVGV